MSDRKARRRRLTPVDKELIIQSFNLLGNRAEVARRNDVCVSSVYKVLQEAEDAGTDLREARATAAS